MKKVKVYRNNKSIPPLGTQPVLLAIETDGWYEIINQDGNHIRQFPKHIFENFLNNWSLVNHENQPCTNCHRNIQSNPSKHSLCYICSKMLVPDLPLDPVIQAALDNTPQVQELAKELITTMQEALELLGHYVNIQKYNGKYYRDTIEQLETNIMKLKQLT